VRRSDQNLLFIGQGSPAMSSNGRGCRPGSVHDSPGYEGTVQGVGQGNRCNGVEYGSPAGTTGAPITYMSQAKQYIVVAVGMISIPRMDRAGLP